MTLAVASIDEIPTTNQELVDLVFTKFNQQKQFGFDSYTGACQYRTFPTGDRDDVQERDDMACCAIGLIIPDNVARTLYRHVFTACTIETLLNHVENRIRQLPADMTEGLAAWFERMAPFNEHFLLAIQNVHDETAQAKPGERVSTFFECINQLGADWNIDLTAIEAMDWTWLETAESGNDEPEDEED